MSEQPTPSTGSEDLTEGPEDTIRRFARQLHAVEQLCSGRRGYHRVTVKAVLTAMGMGHEDEGDGHFADAFPVGFRLTHRGIVYHGVELPSGRVILLDDQEADGFGAATTVAPSLADLLRGGYHGARVDWPAALRPDMTNGRGERYGAALYERANSGHVWADAHPDDRLCFGWDGDAAVTVADIEQQDLVAERDTAYQERAALLAWLAAHYPAVIAPASDIEEPGWQILYLTAGPWQASWHIHPRDADLFRDVEHVPADDPRAAWDGHTTAQKYTRIKSHTRVIHINRRLDAAHAKRAGI